MSAQDPQACTGRTDGYVRRPDCVCSHTCVVHDISRRTKQRTRCLTANPDQCPCKQYEAQSESTKENQ